MHSHSIALPGFLTNHHILLVWLLPSRNFDSPNERSAYWPCGDVHPESEQRMSFRSTGLVFWNVRKAMGTYALAPIDQLTISMISPFLPRSEENIQTEHQETHHWLGEIHIACIGPRWLTLTDRLVCQLIWPILITWLSHAVISFSIIYAMSRQLNMPNQHLLPLYSVGPSSSFSLIDWVYWLGSRLKHHVSLWLVHHLGSKAISRWIVFVAGPVWI